MFIQQYGEAKVKTLHLRALTLNFLKSAGLYFDPTTLNPENTQGKNSTQVLLLYKLLL